MVFVGRKFEKTMRLQFNMPFQDKTLSFKTNTKTKNREPELQDFKNRVSVLRS